MEKMIQAEPIKFKNFTGIAEDNLDIELLPSEASDNRNIWTDELQGILVKTKGFKKIGNLGSTLLLDGCEATTGWTVDPAGSYISVATDNTLTIIGTNNLQFNVAAGYATGVMCYKTISASDWSAYAGVGLYIRSSVNIAANALQFLISASAACATPAETINIPALTAGVWQYLYLPFAAAGSTRTAIISFGINIAVDQVAFLLDIDNIDMVRTDDFIVDSCEAAWTAKANVTSTADNTIVKVGTYSSKNVIVAAFTTGLISTHDFAALDLSKYSYVGFWLYSTIALSSGSLSLCLDDSAACASPLETMAIDKDILANTWTHIVCELANPATDLAIISVGLYANSDFGACTIYIDDIRATKPTVVCKDYPRTDGSTLLVASNGTSVFKSEDTGESWTIVAGGLNNSYFLWICAFNDSCFWGNGSNYQMELTSADVINVYSGTAGNIYYMPKARWMWVHQETTAMLLYATDPVTVRLADPIKLPGEVDWFSTAAEFQKDLEATTGDYLVTAKAFAERSVIYLTKSFIVLSGDSSANFDWLPREFGIGCTMRDSVQVKEGGYIVWANNEGIYRMDETFVPQLISDKIKKKYALLAQPNISNDFWIQSTYAEFVAGTKGANQLDLTSVYGKMTMLPQTTKADWEAGTGVNIDTTTSPGDVLTYLSASLLANPDFESGLANWTNSGTSPWISAASTDGHIPAFSGAISAEHGSLCATTGGMYTADNNYTASMNVLDGSGNIRITKSISKTSAAWSLFTISVNELVSYIGTGMKLRFTLTGSGFTKILTSDAFTYNGGDITFYYEFYSGTYLSYYLGLFAIDNILNTSYSRTSSIITQTIDMGATPSKLGDMCAEVTIPAGTSIEFRGLTQAADSGWSTDPADYTLLGTATTTGNFTASLSGLDLYRYKRIVAVLYTDTTGTLTPVLSSIYYGAQYISVAHNTGTKSRWGQFLVNDVPNNQSITYEIKSATTQGGLATATWNTVLPNNGITEPLANIWVEVRIFFNTTDYGQIPSLDWFQLNWIVASTSTLPTTLTASIIDGEERYYLFGLQIGDSYNNIGFCLDKNWNWGILEGYPIGCATILNNKEYFGCAFDSRIMQLFTGDSFDYGDWVEAIDSYWITSKVGLENRANDKYYSEFISLFKPSTSASDLDISFCVDESDVFSPLGTIDLTDSTGEERLLPDGYETKGRTLKLKLENDTLNGELLLYEVDVFYSIFERTY